jgi:uncharacterized membrane protein YdjX (TVP38/TMEM64 family)
MISGRVGENGRTMTEPNRNMARFPSTAAHRAQRVVVLLLVIAAAYAVARSRDEFSLERLAQREGELRALSARQPALVYGGAFFLYVAVTGLSVPGAAVLSLTYGWFFGFWPALLLVSFASTTGATTAFLLSRFLFRDALQRRFGEYLTDVNAALEREGAFYLFTLRLIPQIPFFVINLVMGLTPMRVWTFWWVSQLGMLAGTAVYVSAGASVGSLEELSREGVAGILQPRTLVAFAVLGLFPLLVKWGVDALRRRRMGKDDASARRRSAHNAS